MRRARPVESARTILAAVCCPLASLIAAAVAPVAASATSDVFTPCPGSVWQITGESPQDHDLICGAVEAAIAFLGSCGLEPPRATRVRVVDALPLFCDRPAHGLYNPAADEVAIASPRACLAATRPGDLFSRLSERDAFASVVAHEAAHAVLDATGLAASSYLEHEYVASVTQLAVLDPAVRHNLLTDLGVEGPVGPREINSIVLGFSPLVFAARAWRDFEARPDGCARLLGLARGTEQLLRLPGE